MVDFSLKRLHIVVAEYPTEDGPMLRGIVFDPRRIFDGHDPACVRRYHEFYARFMVYRTVVVETHMGPVELAGMLSRQNLYIRRGSYTGGVMADMLVHEDRLPEMVRDLQMNPEDYIRSEEGNVPFLKFEGAVPVGLQHS